MPPRLAVRIASQQGVLSAKDAAACGVDGHALARLVRAGRLVRVRTGSYVDASTWQAAGPEERQALRALAVYRTFGDRWVVSHVSALALHGLPLPRLDDVVHLARREEGSLRSRGRVLVHVPLPPEQVVVHRGVSSARPAAALVQSAGSLGLPAAVAAADAALARRLTTKEGLDTALATVRVGGGRPAARLMLQLADPSAESPGESRARVVFYLADLPAPEPQVVITDGGTGYRVDFLFRRHRVVVEFDGAVKYEGAEGRTALMAEKRREDWLRSRGYEVVRLTWPDLDDPVRVRRLVLAAMARAQRGNAARVTA